MFMHVNNGINFRCEGCGLYHGNRVELTQHLITTHILCALKCEICGKATAENSEDVEHHATCSQFVRN